MPRRVKVVTLGCPKNQVDSRQIKGYLREEGYCLTENPEQAEIIIINTCGFIEDARRESIETILDMTLWKKKGNCRVLVAAGCLAQKYAGELEREIPEIDIIIGTGDIPRLPVVLKTLKPGKKATCVGDPAGFLYNDGVQFPPGERKHYAYLKIAEGCDNRCSYCVIPSVRGPYRSRRKEAILTEADALAKEGVKEIILVAQDTTWYGYDIYKKPVLPELLKDLVKIPGLAWVRLLYSYPAHITDSLLQVIKEEKKVCSYLDLPLQHISDGILKKMGRTLGKDSIRRLLDRIRAFVPDMVLRSTFIVGFPGESRKDFEELLFFLEETRFDRAGFFTYSREPGTAAASLRRQIPAREKQRRLEEAVKIQREIMSAKQALQVGKMTEIIVDGPSSDCEGLWEGRTRGDAPEIDGVVYFRPVPGVNPGDILAVKITHSQEFALIGEIMHEFGE
ncbi:MAG: 30S ribosomal protein S12 methylthiotransferase RimO [Peptococcaceae bacterium]|jgi:ribosomal protein S12 methylthiotransferase|nr:30S ribosomal protein S12 methylthiotransferase RimO [Peptococcaceae bacterium]MDH7524107.1 30S ribosomal protein S12 methylthiotransferase RimO [Peptococcaceae bacterium]